MAVGIHQTLKDAANGIGDAVSLILRGDIGGAIQELLLAGKIVAVFFIIYYIMLYVGKVTLFKNSEHHSIARGFAMSMALLGIATSEVIDAVLGLFGGAALSLILLLVAFTLVAVGWYTSRKAIYDSAAKSNQSKAATLERERIVAQQNHENKMTNKALDVEGRIIEKAEKTMQHEVRADADTLLLVDELIKLLSHISAVSDIKGKENLQRQLGKVFQKFTAALYKDYAELNEVEQLAVRIKSFEIKEVNFGRAKSAQGKAKKISQYIRDVITNKIETKPNLENKKEVLEHLLLAEAQTIQTLETDALKLDEKREQLDEQVIKFLEYVKGEFSHDMAELRAELNSALQAGDYSSSMNILHKIKEELLKINKQNESISKYLHQLRSYETERKNIEIRINKIINEITNNKLAAAIQKSKYGKAQKGANKIKNEEQQIEQEENNDLHKESNDVQKSADKS